MTDWHGRRVWLVGASTGIGLACAQALRTAGAQVVISARNPQGVQEWAAQDPGVQWQALDVAERGQVQATARAILAEGPLDLVVYAAGFYRAQRATALNLDDLLARGASTTPDAVLLESEDRQWTYAQVERLAERGARWLEEAGVLPGDRVLVMGDNSDGFLVGVLAGLRLKKPEVA